MSKIAEKLTYKILAYLGETEPEKNPLKTAVLTAGVRAAIKLLHYQSMKGIYEIKQKD